MKQDVLEKGSEKELKEVGGEESIANEGLKEKDLCSNRFWEDCEGTNFIVGR